MQVADAIAYREIDPQSARLLTTVLRLAMQNLTSKQAWEHSSRFQLANGDETVTEWKTFEQEHDLPAALDLSLDPEIAFPPPDEEHKSGALPQEQYASGAPINPSSGLSGRESGAPEPALSLPKGSAVRWSNPGETDDPLRARLGQILRDAETPIPGSPVHVTADEVEIVDVYEREGEQAMMKCIAEQQRSRRRRERVARRLQYEELARNHNIQLAAKKLAADQRKAEASAPTALSAPAQSAVEDSAQPGAESIRKLPHSEAATPEPQAVATEA